MYMVESETVSACRDDELTTHWSPNVVVEFSIPRQPSFTSTHLNISCRAER
jgi:hypothetical protein